MNNLSMISWIALTLVLIGGVDAGLYGLFQFHILEVILSSKFAGRMVYIVIGVAAVYLIYQLFGKKKQ